MNPKLEIRFNQEELDQLRRLAARRDMSVAALVRAKLRTGSVDCDHASTARTDQRWRIVPIKSDDLGEI